ncbi:MAG: alkaline phosphatase family protein [Kiritimatiellae bacterium]|nr:alkaline phosphatase family protein [Kiritimatiellia bacterium]
MTPKSPHSPLPPGIRVPDYSGGSLLNLLASVVRAHGGCTPHRALALLPPAALRDTPKLLLLLVDGMGANQLRAYLASPASSGSPFLARHAFSVIDTVSPPTTAAAVTTVATGSSPATHGLVGWHVHFPDLAADATILPYRNRLGTPYAPPDFPLARYLRIPAPLRTTRARRWLLSTRGIPTSPLSLTQSWWDERRAYTTLPGLVRAVRAFARAPLAPDRPFDFAYAYWPTFDSLCHEHGPFAAAPFAHLRQIDDALAAVARACARHAVTLLVTADHGLTPVPRLVRLDRVPGLYDTFSILPSGDARQLHCFVRPHLVSRFLDILASPPLDGTHVLLSHGDFLASGLLGPGPAHPALDARVGDYVLLAAPGVAFVTPTACTRVEFLPKGHHSGLTPDELLIPLFHVAP